MRGTAVLSAFLVTLLCLSETSSAQEARQVMVVQSDVVVKNRDGSKSPVGLAEVLTVTEEKPDWLWVPSLRGWVPKKDTIAMSDAVQYFSAAIKEKPTAQAWHHRGLAWAALGQHEKALRDFNQAIAIDSRSVAIRVNRANSHTQLENLDSAIRDYNRALEIAPRNVRALNNRGLLFSAQKKYDQAMLDFDAAIRIQPDYAEALNHRGVVYWKQGKIKEAERNYARAMKLKPGLPEPYLNLGAVEKSKSNYKNAVTYYKKSLELSPRFIAANNDLAWILATCPDESVRDADAAVKHATLACQLTKLKNANTLDTLAAALAAKGRFDEAGRRIQQALRISNEESKPQMTVRKNLYLTKQRFIERN